MGRVTHILVDAAADLLVDLVNVLARYAQQPPQAVQLSCVLLCTDGHWLEMASSAVLGFKAQCYQHDTRPSTDVAKLMHDVPSGSGQVQRRVGSQSGSHRCSYPALSCRQAKLRKQPEGLKIT